MKLSEKSILERYLKGETTTSIGLSDGRSGETIRQIVMRNGGNIRCKSERSRRYSVNESCFDSFNADSMYYAGLLMADGNITKDGSMVQIEIHHKDRELVDGFVCFSQYTGPVKERWRTHKSGNKSKMVTVRITSRLLVKALEKFGVIRSKARRSSIPNEISNHKFSVFFFRGLMDGDGCFGIRRGKWLPGHKYSNFGANPQVAACFKDWCLSNIKASSGTCKRTKRFWVIHFGDEAAMKLWKFLYADENGMRLKRKAMRFNDLGTIHSRGTGVLSRRLALSSSRA